MRAGQHLAFAFAAIGLLASGRVGHGAEGEKICVAYHSSAATFNVVDREGKEARAAELGVEIVQADATEDADKQTQQIRDFVTAGCTGLIVQAVERLARKGVTVVTAASATSGRAGAAAATAATAAPTLITVRRVGSDISSSVSSLSSAACL